MAKNAASSLKMGLKLLKKWLFLFKNAAQDALKMAKMAFSH